MFFSAIALIAFSAVSFAGEVKEVKKEIVKVETVTPPLSGTGTATDSCGNEWEFSYSCGSCSYNDVVNAVKAAVAEITDGDCSVTGGTLN